jgi:hypothetical protein
MPDRIPTAAAIANRQAQNRLLRQRVATASPDAKACFVFGCKMPAGRATDRALGRFCEKHGDHHRRHGHPERGSYTAAETNPQRRAALSWLKANRDDEFVKLAIAKVELQYHAAGREVRPRNLPGHTSREKALAVWARLRNAGVDPLFVLAAIAGVTMTFDADTQRPSGKWGEEFRRCQTAKVLMRMAGGEVKRWARQDVVVDPITLRSERPPPQVLRKFPPSTGRVLRHLGKQADDVGEFITWLHLASIKEHAATLPVTKAARKTPWPDRHRAKAKPRIPDEVKPTGSYATQAAVRKERQRLLDKARKDAAIATIITPEQDAARQPKVRELVGGRWVDVTPGDKGSA